MESRTPTTICMPPPPMESRTNPQRFACPPPSMESHPHPPFHEARQQRQRSCRGMCGCTRLRARRCRRNSLRQGEGNKGVGVGVCIGGSVGVGVGGSVGVGVGICIGGSVGVGVAGTELAPCMLRLGGAKQQHTR
eukprot:364523-Chlamydomonas_euryale.AAC.14